MPPVDAQQGTAVRVIEVEIVDPALSERLFGDGVVLPRCEIVFRHMMPAPAAAALTAVLDHGLSLRFEPGADVPSELPASDLPGGLLVPWSQVAYLRYAAR